MPNQNNNISNQNKLKVQDDRSPFYFERNETGLFISSKQSSAKWLSGESFTLDNLRSRIEPWLTSLFQSEHISLLVGSGLSTAVQYLSGNQSDIAMGEPSLSNKYTDNIKNKAAAEAEKNGRGKTNIEDYIRIINDLLRGLEILGYDTDTDTKNKKNYDELKENLDKTLEKFIEDILNIEKRIVKSDEEHRKEAFSYFISFLMSFASRTGTRERLNIFTTNYDRLIESGAELAGLHLLDRFVGTLTPIFRASRLDIDMHYNPPGIRGEPRYLEGVARFTKLHGSIDWIDTGSDIRRIGLPFGSDDINNFLNAPGLNTVEHRKIMIYPNAAKDRETSEYPYVELFRDFAAALCRPNSTLVAYGYGFGDDHINRVIRDMLTIPSTHLVIISYDDAGGRIMNQYKDIARPSQISLLIGSALGDLRTLVDYFLPKPSIDRASIRMSELLRQRYSVTTEAAQESNGTNEEGDKQ